MKCFLQKLYKFTYWNVRWRPNCSLYYNAIIARVFIIDGGWVVLTDVYNVQYPNHGLELLMAKQIYMLGIFETIYYYFSGISGVCGGWYLLVIII